MLWFQESEQESKILGFLPIGRAYKKARVKGSNFNNLMLWIAEGFRWLCVRFNEVFKGLFVCESDFLLEKWMLEFGIPNDIFGLSQDENRTDVFVLKNLMRGNSKWNFQAIANIYGIDVVVESGRDYFERMRLPHTIPHQLRAQPADVDSVLVITFLVERINALPNNVPHTLGDMVKVHKLKKIYEVIKSAECTILYLESQATVTITVDRNGLPNQVPTYLGERSIVDWQFHALEAPDRIKFCKGVNYAERGNEGRR